MMRRYAYLSLVLAMLLAAAIALPAVSSLFGPPPGPVVWQQPGETPREPARRLPTGSPAGAPYLSGNRAAVVDRDPVSYHHAEVRPAAAHPVAAAPTTQSFSTATVDEAWVAAVTESSQALLRGSSPTETVFVPPPAESDAASATNVGSRTLDPPRWRAPPVAIPATLRFPRLDAVVNPSPEKAIFIPQPMAIANPRNKRWRDGVAPDLDDGAVNPASDRRVVRLPPTDSELVLAPRGDATPLPPRAEVSSPAWWSTKVVEPQRRDSVPLRLDLETLALETLQHSQHIRAIGLTAQIRHTEVVQAEAQFDPSAFLESRWVDTSEPVGNVLTTGGPPRLNEEKWQETISLRRKTVSGANFEITQRFGFEDSNSVFFIPANQANSRLSVSLNQPLLQDAGRVYNRSLILLAQHDTQIAHDQFVAGLQDQLARVAHEYWRLYFYRASLVQKLRHRERAEEILAEMRGRADFDVLASQIQRAKAAVAGRQADIVGAEAAVRAAESQLRALTNSPTLCAAVDSEFVPIDRPSTEHIELRIEDAKQTALANRPEVDVAIERIRTATVRLGMAKNQVLPSLGLVLEMYVNGLQGQSNLGKSLGQQLSEGAPSYTVGLTFEIPLGNQRDRARLQQRQLELAQLDHRFHEVVATLAAEVEIATRQVEARYRQLDARRQAVVATTAEERELRRRWQELPGDDRSLSFLLDDLLSAQDRLMRDEERLAEAEMNHSVSFIEYKRALGTLVAGKAIDPPLNTLPDEEYSWPAPD